MVPGFQLVYPLLLHAGLNLRVSVSQWINASSKDLTLAVPHKYSVYGAASVVHFLWSYGYAY
jgi:hypothetical protein